MTSKWYFFKFSVLPAFVLAGMVSCCAATPNLGDMSKLPFKSTRKLVSRIEKVNTDADRLFRIVSSVKEMNRTNPWKFRVSHLEEKRNEDHAVFTENFTRLFLFGDEGITHWYTVKYDLKERVYSALLMDEGIVYGRYRVRVVPLGGKRSEIRNSFIYTALNKTGVERINSLPDEKVDRLLSLMNKSARSYAENGTINHKGNRDIPLTKPLKSFTSEFHQTNATGKVIGSATESFHLAGGIEELCWIPRWRFNLLYSDKKNGRTGNNTVFEESGYAKYKYLRNDMPVYWYVTEYDREKHRFQVAMNFSGDLLGRITLKMRDLEGDNTLWDVTFTYASLTERGTKLMEQGRVIGFSFREKTERSPAGLIQYAEYFKRTGKVYDVGFSWLFRVGISAWWATLVR